MRKFSWSLLVLSMLPSVAFALSDIWGEMLGCILAEAFVTLHMSAFVLMPLAKIWGGANYKSQFKKLFIIRVFLLLMGDFILGPVTVVIDFMAVFVGAFVIVPICSLTGKKSDAVSGISEVIVPVETSLNAYCTQCGARVMHDDKFCTSCGAQIVIQSEQLTEGLDNTNDGYVVPEDFDEMYSLSEDELLSRVVGDEIARCGIDQKKGFIPRDALKKRMLLYVMMVLLVFVFVVMIFFHFPIWTYIGGIIVLVIFGVYVGKYDIVKYLKKQIKARPQEDISNIVMNAQMTMVKDNSLMMLMVGLGVACVLPLVIFYEPRIMYEKKDEGYAVRFYTLGVNNFKTAEIPSEYNGKPVVGLRGNTFSNMPFLTKVELPDTIEEIRGQAFKNDISLVEVNIPKNLKYLGGGAFYGCHKIKEVVLPDSLTFMGGEAFYKATSLETIRLSVNLEEIRGNTFEECVSLKKISIPDSVTRIGGHAFYHNISLESVEISENSKLVEIGSSAFRLCSKLYTINIPNGTYVNERAFKESPTNVIKYRKVDLEGNIDKKLYAHSDVLNIKLGQGEYVNSYLTDSLAYKSVLYLGSISSQYGSSVFTMEYRDANGNGIYFVLSLDNPYRIVNDYLAVEIADVSVFDLDKEIKVNIYYN